MSGVVNWRFYTGELQDCHLSLLWRRVVLYSLNSILERPFIFAEVYGTRGPRSIVGIGTGYGLDGPGIESLWRRDFPHLSRPALGPTQPSVNRSRVFPDGKERPGRDPFLCCGHERVELYLYSPYEPDGLYRASVPVQGCTLPYLIWNPRTDYAVRVLGMQVAVWSTPRLYTIRIHCTARHCATRMSSTLSSCRWVNTFQLLRMSAVAQNCAQSQLAVNLTNHFFRSF